MERDLGQHAKEAKGGHPRKDDGRQARMGRSLGARGTSWYVLMTYVRQIWKWTLPGELQLISPACARWMDSVPANKNRQPAALPDRVHDS